MRWTAETHNRTSLTNAPSEDLPIHSKNSRKRSWYAAFMSVALPKFAPLAMGYKKALKALAVPLHVNSNAVMPSAASTKSCSLVKASRCAAIKACGEHLNCFAIFPRALKIALSPVWDEEAKYDESTRCAASSSTCALDLEVALGDATV